MTTQSVDRQFAQRRIGEVELEKARTLLKRASAQLLAWNELYGRVSTTVLPPAGDVRLAEDIDEFLRPNVRANRRHVRLSDRYGALCLRGCPPKEC
jgi:hypothetical protein